jgi:hypothetical protein
MLSLQKVQLAKAELGVPNVELALFCLSTVPMEEVPSPERTPPRSIVPLLVAAGLCKRVLDQLSYAIGISYPLSVFVDTYRTVKEGMTDADLTKIVEKNFDHCEISRGSGI